MRVWAYKVFSVLLSALVLLASADVAFAGPKKLPKLKRIKTLAPKTVLPKTPTVPVVKPKVAAQVERVVTQKAVTAPQVAPVNTPQVAPVTAAAQDSGTNLTGTQVLNYYYPTWRQELGGKFSKEQLDAVEKAFAATDEWMFVRGEDGELKARNKDEWDYEARFLSILQNNGVSFTEKQIKQLVGGRGVKGFTFNRYLIIKKIRAFTAAKGYSPRQHSGRNSSLTQWRERAKAGDTKAQALVPELELGRQLNTALSNWPENSLEFKNLYALYQQYKRYDSPVEIVNNIKQFILKNKRLPKQELKQNGKVVTLTDLREQAKNGDTKASELIPELELGQQLNYARSNWPENSPEFKELNDLYEQYKNQVPLTKQDLEIIFSKEQLDAVDKAFAATDEWIFVRDVKGELKIRNKDEWDYEARFLTILQNSGVEFTEEQIKQLIGGHGVKGFSFNRYLIIKKIRAFTAAKGYSPRQHSGRNSSLTQWRKLAKDGDIKAQELVPELELGKQLNTALSKWPKNSPEFKELYALYQQYKRYDSPVEIVNNIKQFILKNKRLPKYKIEQNGNVITLTDLREQAKNGDTKASELIPELELGQQLHYARSNWSENSPEFKELDALYQQYKPYDTPTQIINNIKQFILKNNRVPRQGIKRNGETVTLTALRKQAQIGDAEAQRLIQELKLGRQLSYARLNWSKDSPEFNQLDVLSKLYSSSRFKHAQVVDNVKQFVVENNHAPRQSIGQNGKNITSQLYERAKNGDIEAIQLVAELNLGRQLKYALLNWPKDSPKLQELKFLYEQTRNKMASRSAEELYQALVNHIEEYGHYPIWRQNHLAPIINARLRYYQSTMTTDGKYADPWLQKIYEIKQWSERVKRGEVDWQQFPGLFKKHRRTIGEMRAQGILPSKEAAKELEQMPKEEQQAIEQMADNMLTLWEDFEGVWWQQNHKHIITTPQTQAAFNTVLKTVQTQVPGAGNVNISNVLEQVSSMQLGQDGPSYYRVIYRGNNPRIPRAEDFHNVEEIAGLPQQYAQPAYKLNAQHISLDGDDEMVYNMSLTQGVTDREMSAVIDALTPAGWEVRIGAHELLNQIKDGKVHIHLEQIVPTTEEYAMDMSHVLNVNLRALTRGKNPQQVAKTLRYLFTKYLKEDGHQALNNIGKAF